jgi:hypothetical protein
MPLGKKLLLASISLFLAFAATPIQSAKASFIIADDETETDQRVLNTAGDTAVIASGGALNTTDETALILGDFSNLQVINNGTISSISETSDGNTELGISSLGDSAIITNNGTITATSGEDRAEGISSSGDSAIITNNGTITATSTEDDAYGTYSLGDDAVITNNDTITAASTTHTAHGMYSGYYVNNVVITNNGTITATSTEDNAYGIGSPGDNVVITNNGTIYAHSDGGNDESYGVYSSGDNAVITNNGSIFATKNGDDDAMGINSSGDDAVVTNNGSISAVAIANANGIYAHSGTNNITTNNGSISAVSSADYSFGIDSQGDNSTVINNGSISAISGGDYAYGILSGGADAIIVNRGTISSSSSTESIAVSLDHDGASDNTLTNSGKIIASGTDSKAIAGGTGIQTVTLEKGSQIIGAVDLGGGTDSITLTGNGISGRVLTSNVESISIGSNTAGVIIGNEIHSVDPTGTAMLTTNLSKLSLSIHDIVDSRSHQKYPKSSFKGKKSPLWINLFGANSERGADAGNLAYKSSNAGFVGGYELDSKNSKGVIFGVSSGELATKSESFKADVDSIFVGAYKNFNLTKSTTLSTDLIAGYERYSSKRAVVDNINGMQTARSDFNNLFISPSVSLEHKIKLTKMFELRPRARLSYTSSLFDGHRETGTTSSNIKTSSRKAHIFNSRVGVNAVAKLNGHQLELGAGFDTRIIKEDKVGASINATSFKFNTNNDNNVNGKYVRIGVRILDVKGLSVVGSIEKRTADGDESGYFGQLGASYGF